MSLFADTPLSNSVMNSRLGSWMFPFIHANRGAAATYDPDTFVDRVEREVDFGNPLFFATHLTLSHWPYNWAGSPLPGPKTDAVWPDYYVNVINRVDQQFADLMEILRERGVLENAIVVLYSDHGESFGKSHEALVPDGDPLIRIAGCRSAVGPRQHRAHFSSVQGRAGHARLRRRGGQIARGARKSRRLHR